ncbi:cupin domain-containing protein [Parendozoicomonas haliclonae]|uniref:cupin domain-containing protein n=1 Tax=Parendozoicomonas haliclonae TaxID=1960125 RepID=UPI0013FDDB02|nr:cupin domain-containing protein [Parendozoicomonas haliclonae]
MKQSGLTINGGLIEYPEPGQPEITTRKVTLPPGAKTGWHYHPVPIVGYILEGELELQLADGLTKTLKTGEVIYEAINAVHQGVNNSSKDVVILAFYLGIEGEPTTIKVPSSK